MLTDQEILTAITPLYQNETVARMALDVSIDDYRAIEQSVLAKLAGVSVEPVAEVQTLYYGSEHPPVAFTGVVLSDKTDYYALPFRENAKLYTAEAIAAARVQSIDQAAAIVLADCVTPPKTEYQVQYNATLRHTAEAILKLKEST